MSEPIIYYSYMKSKQAPHFAINQAGLFITFIGFCKIFNPAEPCDYILTSVHNTALLELGDNIWMSITKKCESAKNSSQAGSQLSSSSSAFLQTILHTYKRTFELFFPRPKRDSKSGNVLSEYCDILKNAFDLITKSFISGKMTMPLLYDSLLWLNLKYPDIFSSELEKTIRSTLHVRTSPIEYLAVLYSDYFIYTNFPIDISRTLYLAFKARFDHLKFLDPPKDVNELYFEIGLNKSTAISTNTNANSNSSFKIKKKSIFDRSNNNNKDNNDSKDNKDSKQRNKNKNQNNDKDSFNTSNNKAFYFNNYNDNDNENSEDIKVDSPILYINGSENRLIVLRVGYFRIVIGLKSDIRYPSYELLISLPTFLKPLRRFVASFRIDVSNEKPRIPYFQIKNDFNLRSLSITSQKVMPQQMAAVHQLIVHGKLFVNSYSRYASVGFPSASSRFFLWCKSDNVAEVAVVVKTETTKKISKLLEVCKYFNDPAHVTHFVISNVDDYLQLPVLPL